MTTFAAPIHLDALLLPQKAVVKDAFADYFRLPYTDRHKDVNPDTPYRAYFMAYADTGRCPAHGLFHPFGVGKLQTDKTDATFFRQIVHPTPLGSITD